MASKSDAEEMWLCNRSYCGVDVDAGSDEIAASIVSCCGVDVDKGTSGVSISVSSKKYYHSTKVAYWLDRSWRCSE